MALTKMGRVMIFFMTTMMVTLFEVKMAAEYKVGHGEGDSDSAGRQYGVVEYQNWAVDDKNFQVGDTIVLFHDANQVTHEDFQSCNSTFPIVGYSATGHCHFLCNYSMYRQVEQEVVDETAPSAGSPPPPSLRYIAAILPCLVPDSRSSPSSSPSSSTAPNSSRNASSSLYSFKLLTASISLSIFVIGYWY